MHDIKKKLSILENLSFGYRTAEEEADVLAQYFVRTDQWKRMLRGEIDVVYGPKGSGKSAIYTLIEKSSDDLFADNIITATAENPRGATVFRNIVSAPPATEREFISLWKTYILCVIARRFQDYDINNKYAKKLISTLLQHDLLPSTGGLAGLFGAVRKFLASRLLREPSKVTYSASIDPMTGIPVPS